MYSNPAFEEFYQNQWEKHQQYDYPLVTFISYNIEPGV